MLMGFLVQTAAMYNSSGWPSFLGAQLCFILSLIAFWSGADASLGSAGKRRQLEIDADRRSSEG
jgi:hypothetical protein